jgi:hypothetical protein
LQRDITSPPPTFISAFDWCPCLISDPLPSYFRPQVTRDFTSLFDDSLFSFDTSLIPEALSLYAKLQVDHEPLSLIPPQVELGIEPR